MSIAKDEEKREIQQAKKIFLKVEEAIARGGKGAQWLREKLTEILS